MLNTFFLKNGIKVATYNMPTVKSLHLGISVKGGSIVEDAKDNGLAHYMEHMMVQGIPSFPNAELLSSYIESLAGGYNASTNALSVRFNIAVPFLHLEDAIKIASEVFFKPLFPIEAMEKERNAVLNELKQDMDSQWYKYGMYFRKARYSPKSVLLRQTIGSEEIIKKITREDLIAYWKKYFVPKNMNLFVGGNFSNEDLKKLLNVYMETNTDTRTFSGFPKIDDGDLGSRMVKIRHDPKLKVNYVSFSFPSLEMDSPVKMIIIETLALNILGRLRSSRLFRLLRYQKGLVYGVSSNNVAWPGVGYSVIDSEVSSEHLDEVVSLISSTLKEYIENGPTKKEFDFAKHFMINQWLMAFDNPSSIEFWVESQLISKKEILLPEDFIAIIEKITSEDIVKLMKESWKLDKLQLIIQGPIRNTDENVTKYSQMISGLK